MTSGCHSERGGRWSGLPDQHGWRCRGELRPERRPHGSARAGALTAGAHRSGDSRGGGRGEAGLGGDAPGAEAEDQGTGRKGVSGAARALPSTGHAQGAGKRWTPSPGVGRTTGLGGGAGLLHPPRQGGDHVIAAKFPWATGQGEMGRQGAGGLLRVAAPGVAAGHKLRHGASMTGVDRGAAPPPPPRWPRVCLGLSLVYPVVLVSTVLLPAGHPAPTGPRLWAALSVGRRQAGAGAGAWAGPAAAGGADADGVPAAPGEVGSRPRGWSGQRPSAQRTPPQRDSAGGAGPGALSCGRPSPPPLSLGQPARPGQLLAPLLGSVQATKWTCARAPHRQHSRGCRREGAGTAFVRTSWRRWHHTGPHGSEGSVVQAGEPHRQRPTCWAQPGREGW